MILRGPQLRTVQGKAGSQVVGVFADLAAVFHHCAVEVVDPLGALARTHGARRTPYGQGRQNGRYRDSVSCPNHS
jgi:hypothetical protein